MYGTFEEWMKDVNVALEFHLGFTSDDLPDQRYYDMYESGYFPDDAVSEILYELGYENLVT